MTGDGQKDISPVQVVRTDLKAAPNNEIGEEAMASDQSRIFSDQVINATGQLQSVKFIINLFLNYSFF
jgi:hypothetical protein